MMLTIRRRESRPLANGLAYLPLGANTLPLGATLLPFRNQGQRRGEGKRGTRPRSSCWSDAFFKALLFLCCGAVITQQHEETAT
jgi:hypothetical protein